MRLVTALFLRADSIKREIASARTTATTSAIVYPARNSAQKSKQSRESLVIRPPIAHDAITGPPAANPKQMSLSFRAKRAPTHVSGVDMDHDMSARAMRVRGNVQYISAKLATSATQRNASGSSDKARIRVFDATFLRWHVASRPQAKSSMRLTSLELSLVL